jgi:hypothetical protein
MDRVTKGRRRASGERACGAVAQSPAARGRRAVRLGAPGSKAGAVSTVSPVAAAAGRFNHGDLTPLGPRSTPSSAWSLRRERAPGYVEAAFSVTRTIRVSGSRTIDASQDSGCSGPPAPDPGSDRFPPASAGADARHLAARATLTSNRPSSLLPQALGLSRRGEADQGAVRRGGPSCQYPCAPAVTRQVVVSGRLQDRVSGIAWSTGRARSRRGVGQVLRTAPVKPATNRVARPRPVTAG